MLNTGPHSCIGGGGLQLSSAGTALTHHQNPNLPCPSAVCPVGWRRSV